MRRNLAPIFAMLIIVAAAGVTACSSAPTPPPPTPKAAAEAATSTPTSVPPQPLPTARPTNTPAPPTPTSTRTTDVTPTPTLTPTPESGAKTYVIQEGDTLLDIAIRFDTTTEAILSANNLAENDFLQIGQKLVIPALAPLVAENASAAVTPSNQPAPVNQTHTQTAPAASSAPAPPALPQAPPTFNLPNVPAINRPANVDPLTGLAVSDPSIFKHRPLMVRIGNDEGARASQLGLNSADVVYEEIAEWWVTRFSAIFWSTIPDIVAPIRSARLITTQIGPQYQAAVAHSGGSDPVRWQMTQIPIANLDQWFHEPLFFHRPNEGWMTRAAFKAGEAYSYMAANGLDAPVKLRGFTFSPTIDRGEPAPTLFIPYPRATSFTQWTYNPASGKYLRFIKDAPLVDAANGTQIAASNVIVYFAQHDETNIVEDSNGGTSIQITMNGRGPAWFFRDGKLNQGYWQSEGNQTPFFTYQDGTPYPLKPGNSWIEVVPTYFKIGLNSADEASARP